MVDTFCNLVYWWKFKNCKICADSQELLNVYNFDNFNNTTDLGYVCVQQAIGSTIGQASSPECSGCVSEPRPTTAGGVRGTSDPEFEPVRFKTMKSLLCHNPSMQERHEPMDATVAIQTWAANILIEIDVRRGVRDCGNRHDACRRPGKGDGALLCAVISCRRIAVQIQRWLRELCQRVVWQFSLAGSLQNINNRRCRTNLPDVRHDRQATVWCMWCSEHGGSVMAQCRIHRTIDERQSRCWLGRH